MNSDSQPPWLLEGVISLWHDCRAPFVVCVVVALAVRAYCRRITKVRTIPGPETIASAAQNDCGPKGGLVDPVPPPATIVEVKVGPSVPRVAATKRQPRKIIGSTLVQAKPRICQESNQEQLPKVQPLVFFASLTGTTETYARKAEALLRAKAAVSQSRVLEPRLYDLSDIEFDDFFVSIPKAASSGQAVHLFYLILLPSYDIDTFLNTFTGHLRETHHDFRIDSAPLATLAGFSVFGFGDKEGWPSEDDGFCAQAREVDKWMAKLTDRKRAYPMGMGDAKTDAARPLEEWVLGVSEVLLQVADGSGLGEGLPGSGDAVESADEEEEGPEDAAEAQTAVSRTGKRTRKGRVNASPADDLEDLGRREPLNDVASPIGDTVSYPEPVDFTTVQSLETPKEPILKAMVPATSPTYAALTKQGYTIIGTHSGVKICRWTKSALRGRGSCYKRSFYGIASHRCMEATPALSCSNKCVFCWRHGTNPVGTVWRWQTDPPDAILAGALDGHYRKIRALRGVPGVRAARFAEALAVRHCALSLVGEPIFYPRINELLALLHARRISTFLVCNAQHPDQLAALRPPPTQLYVSVDASSKEALRRIDRPLHRDFWERFLRCMEVLRARRATTRTVFRLTLVKGFNAAEADGYADLVARATPCFVEVKGVTYCGTGASQAAGLSMANVPFHAEVAAFARALEVALARRGLEYGLAAEHAHSCCVLLGAASFRRAGRWHSLIDYERFFDLVATGRDFAPEEYMGEPTPEWAAFGQGGFDPADVRVDRKGRPVAGGKVETARGE